MVTSAQIREGRAILNWTVRDLSDRSDVHRTTITRAETDGTGPGHATAAIQRALEAAGVEFTDGDQPGVRLTAKSVSFEVSGKTLSALSVKEIDQNLIWTFYIVERDGRRFLVPRSPRGAERRNPEFLRLQGDASAFAAAEARLRNWID